MIRIRAYAPLLALILITGSIAQFLGSTAAQPILAAIGVTEMEPRYTSIELVNFGALKPAVIPEATRNFRIRIGNHERSDQLYLLGGKVSTASGKVIGRTPFVLVPILAGATASSRLILKLPRCHGRLRVTAYLRGRNEKVHAWFIASGSHKRTPDCEKT